MFFKRRLKDKKGKIIISFGQKIGIVSIRSLEEYIKRNKILKCFIITSFTPHQNVIDYTQKIILLKIIVSSDFKEEVQKIKRMYPDSLIEMINLDDFGGKNMMRDAI